MRVEVCTVVEMQGDCTSAGGCNFSKGPFSKRSKVTLRFISSNDTLMIHLAHLIHLEQCTRFSLLFSSPSRAFVLISTDRESEGFLKGAGLVVYNPDLPCDEGRDEDVR